MLNKLRLFIVGLIVALVVSILTWSGCHKEKPAVSGPLAPTDAARVTVRDHIVTIQSNKGTKAVYVPDSGNAVVSVGKNGETRIQVKSAGFGFKFGGGLVYADGPRFGLVAELAYFNRLGVYGGLGVGSAPVLRPFGAIGYKLDRLHLDNTSLILGIDLHKDPLVGLVVQF